MSKKEKSVAQVTEQQTEKKMTKYDLKMQKRKEEEDRIKKEALQGKIIATVIIVALVAFVLSFPIRSYLAVNSTYITVGDEKITQVEFDYNYALAKNSYLNSYESYFSMMGLDASTIETQAYSDTLTFADYFEQLAVENIINTKSLKKAANEAGFTHDTDAEYDAFVAQLSAEAELAGVTVKEYVKASYGSLATLDRIEDIVRETFVTAAFYEEKANEKMPTAEEITAYYEADKANYDSVDYHMAIVEAELPTTNPDGTTPVDEEGNEVAYEPTDEEVATAMAEAKLKAEELVSTVATEGEAYTNVQEIYINGLVSDWMFDEARQVGDTYVAEDNTYNRYLVVSFDGRYLDEAPSADLRVVVSKVLDANVMLEEWKSGAATEESFIELVSKYDEAGTASVGGMYEGVNPANLPDELSAWVGDSARVAGDTFAINVEGDGNYVCYYVGQNDPVWMINIRATLLNQSMNDYLAELATGWEVTEGSAELAYLHPQEAETDTSAEAE